MTATGLDYFSLRGKVAVVTGASSGLGVAIAEVLAAAGAELVLGARRTDMLNATRSSIEQAGGKAIALDTDVSRVDHCERLTQAAMAEYGQIDILINNAGVTSAVPAIREKPEQVAAVMDVNFYGAYAMAQACARHMKPGSSIVNISSVAGLVSLGLPQVAYSSSKAALIALTRDLAQQWTGRRGIRVNALAPGFFRPTEMTDLYEGDWNTILALVPAGRTGNPIECAMAALFLASDAASYISGSVLPVDGGLLTW
jgi:NAD(P)-dependent dehydrogenase (short-subunit alcohol dehydrogenase family)